MSLLQLDGSFNQPRFSNGFLDGQENHSSEMNGDFEPGQFRASCPSWSPLIHCIWVCRVKWSQFVQWENLKKRYNIGNVGRTASMNILTLFESRYTLKGRYNIGNVGRTASMSMLTLFESRYTLKGRYNIGNVGRTASMNMLTLFESRYTLTL